jgi:hypothetical protein
VAEDDVDDEADDGDEHGGVSYFRWALLESTAVVGVNVEALVVMVAYFCCCCLISRRISFRLFTSI